MNEIRNLLIQHCKSLGFIALFALYTPAHAAPTIVDSISQGQLQGITASKISSISVNNGTLWITDESNLIHQWKRGELPTLFQKGTEDQSFSNVLVTPDNKFVLTDTRNSQFLISNKTNWDIFASEGDQEGELKKPTAAAWSRLGIIYIADTANDRISAFTEEGLFLFTFGDEAGPENDDQNLDQIIHIATDRLGRVYVLDESNSGRITIYSPLGEIDTIIGKDEMALLNPEKVRITTFTVRPDGIILFADQRSGKVFELDWENMKILSSFGTKGKGRGQLNRVSALALDDDGKLYVSDRGNQKIEVFQLDWMETPWINPDADKLSVRPSSVLLSACDVSYVYSPEETLCLNSKENSASIRSHDGVVLHLLQAKFDNPFQAVFDDQEVFILDNDDVKVFDKEGTFKFNFGSKGRRDGDILSATDLAITHDAIYIADTGNKRIQVFSRNGLHQGSMGNKKSDQITLVEPTSIAVNHHGNIYVADSELMKVLVYSSTGNLITQLGQPAEHLHQFTNIYDLMTAKGNLLYVAASTETNPLSVWVYEDSKFIYRFSPTKLKPQAGIDKQWASSKYDAITSVAELRSTAQKGLDSTVPINIDLTLEPMIELFTGGGGFFGNKESWVFNQILNQPSSFAIVDGNNHARHTFTVSSPPKQTKGIVISGDEKTAHLKWLPESTNFTGYYTIYGRKELSSPFEIIQQTLEPQATIARDTFTSIEYRISASTPLDKEGKLSSVYQDQFWLAYLAFQAGDYDQAINMLSETTLTNPQHASAWKYLGKAQMATKAFDEASLTFMRLAQFDQFKQESYHLRAEALIAKKAWLDVKTLVDDAEVSGNVDAQLYSLAASALMQMDDIPSAIYYLDQAVTKEPTSSLWHLALADANYELGAESIAQKELLTATQLAGSDTSTWIEIARTYEKLKFYDDAISSYVSALKIEPLHPQALPELAMLYLNQNKLNEARTIATKMGPVPELKGTSYHILGRVALIEGKAPLALAMLAKAGQSNPDNASIWISMANAYASLGKTDREEEYLLKAVTLDDNDFDVHMRLASFCSTKKGDTCATQHFQRAVEINSKSIIAQLGLAKALMNDGKMSEANEHTQTAIKLDPSSIDAHLTQAEIHSARGMISDSIATLKKAMTLDETNMNVHLALSKAYIANQMYAEATAVTEKAMLLDVRNAEPVMLSGHIFLARQSFDEAIAAFEKAVALAPDNAKYRQQMNLAYLQKKRMVDAGGNLLGPKLTKISFERVFSAAYKKYTDVPVGHLTVNNGAAVDYANIKVSLLVKGYMDFPTTTLIEHIPAGGQVEVPLLASFNNSILGIDEDTGVQTEVRAEYYLAGKPHVETLNESLTIYGKNAIVWDQLDMVGSFATPKDDALAVFIRQLVNAYNPKSGAVNPRVSKAMTVYNGLSAYGIQYLVDPNTPYGKLGASQLDTIQFPRETLRQRSGDCDDLSILLAASLSNLGIETAILDVPAHLMMMFNTGVPESRKDSISLNDEALAILDGQVWIPLEATLIASSFTEAWAEGARKYHLHGKKGEMKIMPLGTAWENYPPVTLPPADFKLSIPDKSMIGDKISKEWGILSVSALERQVSPYRLMLALDPGNAQAQMQIAVVYARNGLYEQATLELEGIRAKDTNNVAALNNLGNIYYLQQDYPQALQMYNEAADVEPNNANIKVNMAMVNYKMGDALQAKVLFDKATEIDEQIPAQYEQLHLLLRQ